MGTFFWNRGKFMSAGLAAPGTSVPEPQRLEPVAPPRYVPPAKKPGRRWGPVLVLLLLVAVAITVWNVRRRQQPGGPGKGGGGSRIAKIIAGPFERALRVGGTVGTSNYAAITAPQLRSSEGRGGGGGGGGGSPSSQLIILKLAAPGSIVKKGDPIADFDNQWEEERLEDHKARVIQARATVEKRRAEIAIENEAEGQLVRSAKADWDKARLDLRTAPIRSAIDAEKLKLAVEEAEARYKQLQDEQQLKKVSQQADLRGLEIQVNQEQNHVERNTHNLKRIHITAPIDGLVVMQPIWRSGQFGQVQEGDQVFPGTYFMQIVDLSKMVVSGWVNQADTQGLVLGQKATIHLEAYPDLALPGHLTSMGALAGAGARGGRSARDLWVRTIPVRFAVDQKDTRLIPDLSASADLVFKRQDRALQIPREAVVSENGKTYAQVRRGESLEKREIQLGPHNHTHAVALAGLNEGDEVAIP